MSIRSRLTQTCTITRNPSSGGSGVTTVATDLACTVIYSVLSRSQWWDMAFEFQPFEVMTAVPDDNNIKNNDVLLFGDTKYSVRQVRSWQGSSLRSRTPFLQLLLEKKT